MSTMYAGDHAGFSTSSSWGGSSRPPTLRQRADGSTRSHESVRLTQRGRLVILLTLIALALMAFTFVGSPAASIPTPHHPTTATVVVQQGQTLWDIAAEAAPGADPRDVVASILELNGLRDPGSVRPGQPLYVPTD